VLGTFLALPLRPPVILARPPAVAGTIARPRQGPQGQPRSFVEADWTHGVLFWAESSKRGATDGACGYRWTVSPTGWSAWTTEFRGLVAA
jgi:hypothetical protein